MLRRISDDGFGRVPRVRTAAVLAEVWVVDGRPVEGKSRPFSSG